MSRNRWHPSHEQTPLAPLPVRVTAREGKAARNRAWRELITYLPGLPARYITSQGELKT